MNNRIEEIDLFLKRMANIYAINPNHDIYASLGSYDFNDFELTDSDVSSLFGLWQQHFKSKHHITTGFRRYDFLSFESSNFNDHSCVKMYLSFPKTNIKQAVIKIFDYIDKKKIVTCSKVANCLRSDGVVLRVSNVSDANLIMNYVNNDKKLSSWMKRTNPFVSRNGSIGVAYDEELSYNSFVADIIRTYLIMRRNENNLIRVSYNDFVSYVKAYYRETFQSLSGIKKLLNTSDFKKNYHRISGYNCNYAEENLILNYEKVCTMLMQSLDCNKNIDDYLKLIASFQDKERDYQMTSYYGTIINSEKQKEILATLKKILDDYIRYLDSKNIDAKRTLKEFFKRGDYNLITREHSFRSLFYYNNMLGTLATLTNNNIDDYVSNIINLNETKDENINYNPLMSDVKKIVDEYIEYGLMKYGSKIVCNQLSKFLLNGDYNLITRDNQLRDKFFNFQLASNIHQLFSGSVDEYVLNFSINHQDNKNSLVQKNQVRQALVDEYIRYAIANYGIETACLQLKSFMINGNYNLITGNYNLRQRFIKERMDLYIAGIVNMDVDKYVYEHFNNNECENEVNIKK